MKISNSKFLTFFAGKRKALLISNSLTAVLLIALSLVFPFSSVLAHVTVKPNQVGIGAFQTFTVGVPNEKDNNPTIGLRLVIPEGLEHISPNVKLGWRIEVKTEKEYEGFKGPILNNGNEAPHTERVTEIVWSGGSIPAGQRDDFMFSAKAPAEEKTLQWKAYQTYGDGSIVAWDLSSDQQPKNEKGEPDFSKSGPYSETKVVNDLKASPQAASQTTQVAGIVQESKDSNLPLVLSGLAVIVSTAALVLQFRRRATV